MRKLVFLFAACSGLAAQDVVVPSAYDQQEAGSRGFVAGFEDRFRQQILLHARELGGLIGKQIDALWFRRDAALGLPYAASSSLLTVRLSPAQRSPVAPSSLFTDNSGPAPVTVFNGTVALPASTAAQNPPVWAAPNAVELRFIAPYPYLGGDLCIEIEGEPVAAGGRILWSVDAVQEFTGSRVRNFGTPCGVGALRSDTTAAASARFLLPGSDAFVTTFGEPGTPGLVMFGAAQTSVSLQNIGATGCTLYAAPTLVVPFVFGTPLGSQLDSGHLLRIPLPLSANALGMSVFAQGVNLESAPISNPAGITTTNGLELTIGTAMPPAALSTVRSLPVASGQPYPASGRVFVGRGPIVRLTHR